MRVVNAVVGVVMLLIGVSMFFALIGYSVPIEQRITFTLSMMLVLGVSGGCLKNAFSR